jgi:hypothetical protein
MDVGQPEDQLEKRRVVFGLAAHRHDDRVDAVLVEIRVVDHRRLEALGRMAEMRDKLGASADRHRASL